MKYSIIVYGKNKDKKRYTAFIEAVADSPRQAIASIVSIAETAFLWSENGYTSPKYYDDIVILGYEVLH